MTKRLVSSIPIAALFAFVLVHNASGEGSLFDAKRIYKEKREAIVAVIAELDEAQPRPPQEKEIKQKPFMTNKNDPPRVTTKIFLLPYLYDTNADSKKVRYAMGAGIIFRKDGLIVTSYHVIAGAKQITVELADGTIHSARVVGFDASEENDIAFLQISVEKELPTLSLSVTPTFTVGTKLLNVGHPRSLRYTASEAVISRVGNEGDVLGLQIHSSVIPGNSGGPLIDARGEVVGIVFASLNDYDTQGFATPAKRIQRIFENIMSTDPHNY